MIATLHGKLQSRTDDSLIVNVGGIGFRVRAPSGTIASHAKRFGPNQRPRPYFAARMKTPMTAAAANGLATEWTKP